MESGTIEFRILGPLEVRAGRRRIGLSGAQAEKLLAVLLLAGGRVVPLERLIAVLWDGEPPRTAKQQIHKVVAKLRQQLPGTIETEGAGYRVNRPALDATRFEELAATHAVPGLAEALTLWRGQALAGIGGRVLRSAAAALDERRLEVTERLIGLRLEAGDVAAAVQELPALVAEHPMRETLRGHLMVALYRSGRRADALATYAEVRALLAEELGLDPDPELTRLYEQILRADPALGPARRVPCTLPYDVPDFTGRAADLDRVLRATGSRPIHVIDGMAGVGKTVLAVHVAHRLAPSFPDGQLLVDLHGYTPGTAPVEPADALETLLRMLGVPAAAIPEDLSGRVTAWRCELADRKVLLVLDNAAGAAQVRPLLPGTPTCLTLVTSRVTLGALDGAGTVTLDVLPAADALTLLGNVAGATRVAAEPDAAHDVVRSCGYLPLAIRLAATRLASRPLWTVASLAERLRDAANRPALLAMDDRGVASAFGLSYQQLEPADQRVFRLLGAHPGADFDRYAAAALAELTPDEAGTVLERLVDTHLLVPRTADRYAFHDLLRDYARQLGHDDAAGARLHDYYLAAAVTATDQVNRVVRHFEPVLDHPPHHQPRLADRRAAMAWLGAERANLVAACQGWQLPCVLRAYFEQAGYFSDWRSTHETALRRTDDAYARAMLHVNLGVLAGWSNRFGDGIEHLQQALSTVSEPGLRAAISTSIGMLLHQSHRDEEAATRLTSVLATRPDNPRVAAMARCNLGLAAARLGRREESLALHRDAVARARASGPPSLECAAHLGAGETALRVGAPALPHFEQALRLARGEGFRIQQALALDGIAHATGDASHWREALSIFAELGVAQAELVRDHLDNPGLARCDMCQVGQAPRAARHSWARIDQTC